MMSFIFKVIIGLIYISTAIANINYCKKIQFWNTPKRGANFFNENPTQLWWKSAKKQHIQFVRIAPNRWKTSHRDFLIGNTDHYHHVVLEDLRSLDKQISYAHKVHIKVIITMLSLPCSRWKQQNGNKDDLGIWRYKKCWKQSIAFWTTLAKHYKNNPTVIGYDILNEPHPEVINGIHDFWHVNFQKWYAHVKDTPQDLNLFYRNITAGIRKVDPATPIIIESGLYDTPWAFRYLKPLTDQDVLYSFHMYEPYQYTTKKINQGRYYYPGKIPAAKDFSHWNKATLEKFLQPIVHWQKQYHIPSKRILVGEFGVNRQVAGADQYLTDLITIFNQHNWHWAFYTYRPDAWTGMNYELGTKPLGWRYWQAVEQGHRPKLKLNDHNPLFTVIRKALERKA